EMKVIDKQWSASGDTVFYSYDVKKKWRNENWEYFTTHDTSMSSYKMLDRLMIEDIGPDPTWSYTMFIDPGLYHERVRNGIVNNWGLEYGIQEDVYVEGLGIIKSRFDTWWEDRDTDLIYYKKGEEEWGSYTPIPREELYVKNRPAPFSQMSANNYTKTGFRKDKLDLNTIIQPEAKQLESKEPCFSCLPEGIEFRTQAQIDEFQMNYPECTNIEGDVKISGGEITNLDGINMLNTIEGSLMIHYNTSLTSLSGLESLSSIDGALSIFSVSQLTSLTGLDNLTTIGGFLYIERNRSLVNLYGLNNLTSIADYIHIEDNLALTSLSGLDNLSTLGGHLIINSYYLTSLSTFFNLTSIG
ncbi:MAG: hypothetical protein K8F24_06705, partial [Bacteroidales bacterium]|nr:hypothetical protein [Bacteroidales bacterium]